MTAPAQQRHADLLQELADAEATLHAVQVRARTGDDTVTPQELAARESLVSLLRVRIEGAAEQVAAWDARQRAEQYQALAAEARAVAGIGHGRIADRFAAAVAAIADLWDAAAERERRLRALRDRARQVYALAEENGELPALFATGITEPTDKAGFGASIKVQLDDGTTVPVHHVEAAAVAIAAAAVALESRTRHSGHSWSVLHADTVGVAAHVDRALPAVLPDDWRHTR